METTEANNRRISPTPLILIVFLLFFILLANTGLYAQNSTTDLARYTPDWIIDGFADAGATHEPWIFQVRRNDGSFNLWQKDQYEYQLSEEYIKALSESGVTVYHVNCYKGFGFKAEKDNMDKVAKAAAIAHKFGMKVDTYIQWNTMAYEFFFLKLRKRRKIYGIK